MANGIFSWGIYFGYGLAYIYGKYLSEADILGQGWRASYVIGGAPGIVIGVLILLILRDTRNSGDKKEDDEGKQTAADKFKELLGDLWTAFRQPTLILLVISASVRQIAGLAWANNNVNYFTEYYPDKDIAYYWLTVCSVFAGGFGVVSGGWITDRLQKRSVRIFNLIYRKISFKHEQNLFQIWSPLPPLGPVCLLDPGHALRCPHNLPGATLLLHSARNVDTEINQTVLFS